MMNSRGYTMTRLCSIRSCFALACLLMVTSIAEAQSPRSSIDRRLRPNGGFWQSNSGSRSSGSSMASRSNWVTNPTQSGMAAGGRYSTSGSSRQSVAALPPGRYWIQGRLVVVHPTTTPKSTVVQHGSTASTVVAASANYAAQAANGQATTVAGSTTARANPAEVERKGQTGTEKIVLEAPSTQQAPVD